MPNVSVFIIEITEMKRGIFPEAPIFKSLGVGKSLPTLQAEAPLTDLLEILIFCKIIEQ